MVTGPMPRHAESHQTEGKDRRIDHEIGQSHGAGYVGDEHEHEDRHAEPEGAEVTGHQTGEDIERGAAFTGRGNDLFAMFGLGAGKDLDKLRNDGRGERTATDDDRELPPQAVGKGAQLPLAHGKGYDDGKDRRDPDQCGQRVLEIDLLLTPLRGAGEGTIDPVGANGRDDHQDTHDEYPDQELS